eukprot:1177213-Prorocentrum_minimum.AAC.1
MPPPPRRQFAELPLLPCVTIITISSGQDKAQRLKLPSVHQVNPSWKFKPQKFNPWNTCLHYEGLETVSTRRPQQHSYYYKYDLKLLLPITATVLSTPQNKACHIQLQYIYNCRRTQHPLCESLLVVKDPLRTPRLRTPASGPLKQVPTRASSSVRYTDAAYQGTSLPTLSPRGEQWDRVGNWRHRVRKGEGKLGVLSAPLPLLTQVDP